MAAESAEAAGVQSVAVGGGCFQNERLLSTLTREIRARSLEVLAPRRLSPNDGCISYGQAAVAAARLDHGLEE